MNQRLLEASENYRLSYAKYLSFQSQFLPTLSATSVWNGGQDYLLNTQVNFMTDWGLGVTPQLSKSSTASVSGALGLSLPIRGQAAPYFFLQRSFYLDDLVAAQATYRFEKSAAVAQVIKAYWEWVEADARALSAQMMQTLRQEMLGKISKLIEAQVRPSSDHLVARAQARQSHMDRLDARADRLRTIQALSEWVGFPLEAENYQVGTPLPSEEYQLPDYYCDPTLYRDDYRSLVAQSRSQLAYLRSLDLASDPALSLVGSIEQPTLGSGPLSYQVGFLFQLPIWNVQQESARLNYDTIASRFQRQLDFLSISLRSQEIRYRLRLKDTWESYSLSLEHERDFSQIYENELKKMTFGDATLLDVLIQIQNRESAIFQRLEYQKIYAQTRVDWGFSTGLLLHSDGTLNWELILGDRDVTENASI